MYREKSCKVHVVYTVFNTNGQTHAKQDLNRFWNGNKKLKTRAKLFKFTKHKNAIKI